jgi:hypothetical protein
MMSRIRRRLPLITLGVVSLHLATLEYRRSIRTLERSSLSVVAAGSLSLGYPCSGGYDLPPIGPFKHTEESNSETTVGTAQ